MRGRERATMGVMNAVAAATLSAASLLLAPAALAGDAPEAARRTQLVSLVRQDCGSCHGMTLKGGLGPALTRAALRDKPPTSLVATVLYGRPGTPMPPWREFVTSAEAEWIVRQLQEGTLHER
jgi:cytochrome c55X